MAEKKALIEIAENSKYFYEGQKEIVIYNEEKNQIILKTKIGYQQSISIPIQTQGTYYYGYLNEKYSNKFFISTEDINQEKYLKFYININDIYDYTPMLSDTEKYQIRTLTQQTDKNKIDILNLKSYLNLISCKNELSEETSFLKEFNNLNEIFLNKKNSYNSEISSLENHNNSIHAHKNFKSFIQNSIIKHNGNILAHKDIDKEIKQLSTFIEDYKTSYNYCSTRPGTTTNRIIDNEKNKIIYLTTNSKKEEVARKEKTNFVNDKGYRELHITTSTGNNHNIQTKSTVYEDYGKNQIVFESRNPKEKKETYGLIVNTSNNKITYRYTKGAKNKSNIWNDWENNSIFSEVKLCALDTQGNVAFYLNNKNSYLDERFDPNLHDLMIEIPRTGYKISKVSSTETLIEITEKKYEQGYDYSAFELIDEKTNKKISCDKIYVSAFLISKSNQNTIKSIPNADILLFKNNQEYLEAVSKKGNNFQTYNYNLLTLLQIFFLLIYQNEQSFQTDKRTKLITGLSHEGFCNFDKSYPNKFLGLEDFYSSIIQLVDKENYKNRNDRQIGYKNPRVTKGVYISSNKYLSINKLIGEGFINFGGSWKSIKEKSVSLISNNSLTAGRFISWHEDNIKGATIRLNNKISKQNVKFKIENSYSETIEEGIIKGTSFNENYEIVPTYTDVNVKLSDYYKISLTSNSFDSNIYSSPEIIQIKEEDLISGKVYQIEVAGQISKESEGVQLIINNSTNYEATIDLIILSRNKVLETINIFSKDKNNLVLQLPNVEYQLNIKNTNKNLKFKDNNPRIIINSEDIKNNMKINKTIIEGEVK